MIADARDPVGLASRVEAAGGPADVTVVCVDVPGCEHGAILATAEQLLAERPLADFSVDDLAKGAGISRPTFYFYFPSKNAVLLDWCRRSAARAVPINFEGRHWHSSSSNFTIEQSQSSSGRSSFPDIAEPSSPILPTSTAS